MNKNIGFLRLLNNYNKIIEEKDNKKVKKQKNNRFKPKKTFYEHLQFAHENNIINKAKWLEFFKEKNKVKEDYYVTLSSFSNKYFKEEDFFPNRFKNYLGHKKYVKENDIKNTKEWSKISKNTRLEERLCVSPWDKFKGEYSFEDFFEN